jgi:hypothetical protein
MAAAVWESYRARVADAVAGKPWSDGVPGDWILGDRILDVTLLPIFFAFVFVALRAVAVKFVFEVGSFLPRVPSSSARARSNGAGRAAERRRGLRPGRHENDS